MSYNRIMDNCNCNKRIGAIRRMDKVPCPQPCEIPLVEVETTDGIRNLASCLVHVLSTNTTYYIDGRSRAIVTWSGDLFLDGYDYEANPLNLRAKKVYDFANNREIIYDNKGAYRIIALGV